MEPVTFSEGRANAQHKEGTDPVDSIALGNTAAAGCSKPVAIETSSIRAQARLPARGIERWHSAG